MKPFQFISYKMVALIWIYGKTKYFGLIKTIHTYVQKCSSTKNCERIKFLRLKGYFTPQIQLNLDLKVTSEFDCSAIEK